MPFGFLHPEHIPLPPFGGYGIGFRIGLTPLRQRYGFISDAVTDHIQMAVSGVVSSTRNSAAFTRASRAFSRASSAAFVAAGPCYGTHVSLTGGSYTYGYFAACTHPDPTYFVVQRRYRKPSASLRVSSVLLQRDRTPKSAIRMSRNQRTVALAGAWLRESNARLLQQMQYRRDSKQETQNNERSAQPQRCSKLQLVLVKTVQPPHCSTPLAGVTPRWS